jgi:hypothetical protein
MLSKRDHAPFARSRDNLRQATRLFARKALPSHAILLLAAHTALATLCLNVACCLTGAVLFRIVTDVVWVLDSHTM